jgi:hypothetical protein
LKFGTHILLNPKGAAEKQLKSSPLSEWGWSAHNHTCEQVLANHLRLGQWEATRAILGVLADRSPETVSTKKPSGSSERTNVGSLTHLTINRYAAGQPTSQSVQPISLLQTFADLDGLSAAMLQQTCHATTLRPMDSSDSIWRTASVASQRCSSWDCLWLHPCAAQMMIRWRPSHCDRIRSH